MLAFRTSMEVLHVLVVFSVSSELNDPAFRSIEGGGSFAVFDVGMVVLPPASWWDGWDGTSSTPVGDSLVITRFTNTVAVVGVADKEVGRTEDASVGVVTAGSNCWTSNLPLV